MTFFHKSIIALLLLAFFVKDTTAQPTLEAVAVPEIGSSMEVFAFGQYEVFQGSSGSDVEWDFSDLPDTNQQTAIFLAPNQTPFGDQLSEATFAVQYSDSLRIKSTDIKYEFFNLQGGMINKIGETNSIGNLLKYQNPIPQLPVPMTYENSHTGEFNGIYITGQKNTGQQDGSISVVADGYGTLRLPYANIQNVLRVKTKMELTETIEEFDLTYTKDAEIYTWYHPNLLYPLLTIYFELGESGATVSSMAYIRSPSVTSVADTYLSAVGINASPNPCTTQTTLQYELTQPAIVGLQLYNPSGQLLQQQASQYQTAGQHQKTISTADLPAGMYFAGLIIDGKTSYQAIIVQ